MPLGHERDRVRKKAERNRLDMTTKRCHHCGHLELWADGRTRCSRVITHSIGACVQPDQRACPDMVEGKLTLVDFT